VRVRRTLKYRPYENRRNRRLHRQIDIAGQIWNHITALQRRYYRMYGGYINMYRMLKYIAKLRNGRRSEWRLLGSQVVQQIVERHDAAYQRFFARAKTKQGRRVSPPRFRKVKRYPSFTLKQSGWKYLGGNKIRIGKMVYKFALSRPVEGEIKTVTIKRDTVERLFICFSGIQDVEPSGASAHIVGGLRFWVRDFLDR
jgi:putative transposase